MNQPPLQINNRDQLEDLEVRHDQLLAQLNDLNDRIELLIREAAGPASAPTSSQPAPAREPSSETTRPASISRAA